MNDDRFEIGTYPRDEPELTLTCLDCSWEQDMIWFGEDECPTLAELNRVARGHSCG